MAHPQLVEASLIKPLSIQSLTQLNRPLVHPHPRHQNLSERKATIFCSSSDAGESKQSISQPVARSSRGRTRKSLGLDEAKPSSFHPAQEALSEPSILKEREGTVSPSLSASRENAAVAPLQEMTHTRSVQEQGTTRGTKYSEKYHEVKSLIDWAKRNRPVAENFDHHIPDTANSKEFSKRIQDLINADLDRRYKSDDEDSDNEKDPLFVEEDDPYWLDEPDDGWGFKVSDLFKEKFGFKEGNNKNRKVDYDDDVSDIPERDWDLTPEKWSAKDVDAVTWADTVFGDPSPLVVLIYERYGKKGRECYHVLRELEEAANRMWDCKKVPPRFTWMSVGLAFRRGWGASGRRGADTRGINVELAGDIQYLKKKKFKVVLQLVKLNVAFEEDLSAAIGVKEVPMLLFIKAGKMIHYQSGYFTADDLLRMISYFYYGAARPPCLKKVDPASMKLRV